MIDKWPVVFSENPIEVLDRALCDLDAAQSLRAKLCGLKGMLLPSPAGSEDLAQPHGSLEESLPSALTALSQALRELESSLQHVEESLAARRPDSAAHSLIVDDDE